MCVWHSLVDYPKAQTKVQFIKGFSNKCGKDTDKLCQLASTLEWDSSQRIPRSVCWMTKDGCSCPYKYGHKVNCKALPFPGWVQDLTDFLQQVTGLTLEFNACNANKYEGGLQAVGWHSDDEKLLKHKDGEDILSLSLGVSREFEVRKEFSGAVKRILLDDGDLLWMSGKCQRFFKHSQE